LEFAKAHLTHGDTPFWVYLSQDNTRT
jgi:hypothetical protein